MDDCQRFWADDRLTGSYSESEARWTFRLAKSWFVGKPDKFVPVPTWTVTAFYKGESQERKLSRDWKEQRFVPSSPAHVM